MSHIKAIETYYKGYRFRSRLEARWAVFFDSLDAKWRYEPEGFLLDGTAYLPDFWLQYRNQSGEYPRGIPSCQGFYLEIKPQALTPHEERLCLLLAQHTGHCVYAAAGNVGRGEFIAYKWHYTSTAVPIRNNHFDEMGLNTLLAYLCFDVAILDRKGLYNFDRLDTAFSAARSARFEHGENTAPKKTRIYYDQDDDEPGECADCGGATKARYTYCYECYQAYK